MQLEDFRLSEEQVEEGIDLHDAQHLLSLPRVPDSARAGDQAVS